MRWFDAASTPAGSARPSREHFEALEPRIVLSAVENLPSIFDLESPNNPVVLFETNLGDIYFELFPQDAPNHVANFLEYLNRGLYGESFFHRLAQGFALQGGGFAFDENMGLSAIFAPDLPPIANDFGRANLEYTLALATNAAGGTSQFFINLDNNSGTLDPQGFTVFGQVLPMSTSVVDAIAALDVQILSGDPRVQEPGQDRFGNPLFSNGPILQLEDNGNPANFAGAFGFNVNDAVPVLPSFSGAFDAEDLVTLVNAQLVKPEGGFGFFENLIAYPEGFASNQSRETLTLVNPNASADARIEYQVVIRYQSGLRDQIVQTGVINGGDSTQIILHDPQGSSLVRTGVPYAIEVYSSAELGGGGSLGSLQSELPLGATINRFDFGNSTSESLTSAGGAFSEVSHTATIPSVLAGEGARSFILWQNLGNYDRTIEVDFTYRDSMNALQTVSRTFDLGAYRRGGFDITNIPELVGLPAGTYVTANIAATDDDGGILAAVSSWTADEEATFRPAFTTLAVPGQGAARGVFTGVLNPNNGRAILSGVNNGQSATVITLEAFVGSNGIPLIIPQTQFILQPGERAQVDLRSIVSIGFVPRDTEYTLRYRTAGSGDVAMDLVVERFDTGDATSTRAQTQAASAYVFGDLFLPGSGSAVNQTINLFNLFASENVTIELSFVFSDGTTITAPTINLGTLRVSTFVVGSFAPVTSKIAGNPSEFQNFSVIVEGFDADGVFAQPIFASMARSDTRVGPMSPNTAASSGSPVGQTVSAASPIFLPQS